MSALTGYELLSGGFDAEYGNAQSGIVNIQTQEGGRKFSGLVKYMTDDYGAPDRTFNNFDRVSVGVGGPVGLPGFGSVLGYLVGGLIIGVGEALFEFSIGPMIGGATENWFAYVLALVFLVFRPQGLFGEKIIERV